MTWEGEAGPGAGPDPPALAALREALAHDPRLFRRDPVRAGLDFAMAAGPAAGRARLKVHAVDARTLVLLAYKPSVMVGSDDRFAYGFLVAKGRPFTEEEWQGVLAYLASGFHPGARPPGLRRAVPHTIPR
jgi:hypothetical protein